MEKLMMISKMVPNCGRGLSILVVDHDTTSLMYLASMLEQYSYKVTTTELASVAISMIREGKGRFKLIMVDINVDDMNSLSFLRILLTTDIPIILMSSERSQKVAEKAIAYGACLHLEKPISMNDLKYLWQHAYRKPAVAAKSNRYFHGTGIDLTTNDPKGKNKKVTETDGGNVEANCITTRLKKTRIEQMLAAIKELKHGGSSLKSKTKRSYEYDDKEDHGNGIRIKSNPNFTSAPTVFEKTKSTAEEEAGKEKNNQSRFCRPRARRLVWNQRLQHKFVAALTALGDEKARPKSILKMMNEPNLTHRQVASHLQKYKAQLQRISKASPSNLTSVTDASTRIHTKPGFFYMLQKDQPVLSHLQKYFNVSNGGTSQFPKLPQDSIAHFSSQYQNQQLSNVPQDMTQKLHVPVDSTDSISSLNQTQQWHQKLNVNVGFDPIYSINQTLQLPNMSQSMYQKLNFIPDSTSTSILVNQNQVLESLTQTAEGIDTIMPDANKSLTGITVGNPEMDTTARGVTSAILSENWNQHPPELVDLLKVLDEEADECRDSAIEPHPAEVDQYCELLKEAMLGNNEHP